jgi:hypothetical protein
VILASLILSTFTLPGLSDLNKFNCSRKHRHNKTEVLLMMTNAGLYTAKPAAVNVTFIVVATSLPFVPVRVPLNVGIHYPVL